MPKAADTPPYTIDETVLRRYPQRLTAFERRRTDAAASYFSRSTNDSAITRAAANEPGHTRVESAMVSAGWTVAHHFHGAYSSQPLGDPHPLLCEFGPLRDANPDEMNAHIKTAARMFGATRTGIAFLDRRWVYSQDGQGRPIDIPTDYKHVIVAAVPMDAPAILEAPGLMASMATGVGYSRMAFVASCLAEFIRNLGYGAIPMGNDTALSIPLAIDAGVGEMGRSGMLITPECGPCVRLCKIFTDMPLATDPPLNTGIAKVCAACGQCARACPAGAISDALEPSFDVPCPSNNPGVLRWPVNSDTCFEFWMENGGCCSVCIASCPFTKRAMKRQ